MSSHSGKVAWALVALLFIALYVVPLAIRPFSAPDGFRYAEVAREILASGDWVVPRLNGMSYFEKPIFGYWATATSMSVLGLNEFAVRLPAALATGLTALLLGFVSLRHGGGSRVAPLAAAGLLTSFLAYVLGTSEVLDAPFSLFVSAGMAFSFLYLEESNRRKARLFLAVAGGAIGLAFLTKGVLALVLGGVALLPYLIRVKRLGDFLRDLWIPVAVAVAVAAPWSLLVAARSDFWQHFFWVVNVQRFVNPSSYQHAHPAWFYVVRLPLACLPWVLLVPAAFRGWRGSGGAAGTRRLRLYAASWLIMPLLFFSASSGKLFSYLLVCVPPAVLLVIEPALSAARERGSTVLRKPALANAILAGSVLVGYFVFLAVSEEARGGATANPVGAWAVGLSLTFWLLVALVARRVTSSGRQVALLIVSPALLLFSAHLVVDESLSRTPSTEMVSELQAVPPETILMADRDSAHAMCWITRRTDVEMVLSAGEFEPGLDRDEARFLVSDRDLADLLAGERPLRRSLTVDRPVAVMVAAGRWDRYSEGFAQPDRQWRTDRFVLSFYESRESPSR